MISLAFTLFIAGVLTILLPCILPLIPIVLGVSIADRNRWRPLVTITGMLVSFVGFTFLLQVVLSQFVELADIIRIATFYILLLFGLGFTFHTRIPQLIGAVFGGLFFWEKGWLAMVIAVVLGIVAMEIGGKVAGRIQQFGSDVQQKTREGLGTQSILTSFIIGLTMGLVWVPCAGPALGFAFSLVRDQPGLPAFLYLSAYGIGAGVPLLLIGYGGQAAVHSVRAFSRYTGVVKQVSGVLLILSAIAFQFNLFQDLQTWLVQNTNYGSIGTEIEESLFGKDVRRSPPAQNSSSISSAASSSVVSSFSSSEKAQTKSSAVSATAQTKVQSNLPILGVAPSTFVGLGPWHNSPPLDLLKLRGKVVLIDFWTYSCINCIRTFPHLEALWQKHKEQPYVQIGIHSPEFTFEKSEKNVAAAIKEHGLTYPTAQDNDFKTWNAFNNQYWPAHYLIDAEGNIRYTHFGEGAYEETDQAVTSLLAEIGSVSSSEKPMPQETTQNRLGITPEIYLHSRSWGSFGNAQGQPSDASITYSAPTKMELHTYYLGGTWQLIDDERQVLRSDSGEIRIRALAGEVNLVLGLEGSTESVQADIEVDGKPTKSITIQNHDLYNLFKGEYGEHDIVLKIRGNGVAAYAFTFGS